MLAGDLFTIIDGTGDLANARTQGLFGLVVGRSWVETLGDHVKVRGPDTEYDGEVAARGKSLVDNGMLTISQPLALHAHTRLVCSPQQESGNEAWLPGRK